MTGRERVRRALRFEPPDRAPRELWALPGVGLFRKPELDALAARFPPDFAGAPGRYGRSDRARGDCSRAGEYVDEWGVVWTCMDIEELGRRYRGRITFWGEIDRQHLLPFGTPEEVRAGVRRVRRALDDGHGGVIAQCEWGLKDPAENIAAVFEAWEEPRPAPAAR